MKKLLLVLFVVVVAFVSCSVGRRIGSASRSGKVVAVVRLDGEILDPRKVVDRLQEAQDDSTVGAVVLRIESPGGAVGASQEIYGAVRRLDARKPVVASIGNAGASGGYYAALGARRIWANPGSLTGSIGVITQFTDVHGLMEKLGVRSETVKSGEAKDAGSPFRPLTERERGLFQAMVMDVHAQFRGAVAERRRVDSAALDTLADGRVLTGRQAFRARLVDSLGGLHEAVEDARRTARLSPETRIDDQEPHRPLWKKLLDADPEGLSRILPTSGSRVEYRMP